MTRSRLVFVALLLATVVPAIAVPYGVQAPYQIDTSQFAKPADVAAAIAAATPSPCSTPAADTLAGTAGSGTPCMARPDSARPTAVQSSSAVTDASGNITVTFQRTMLSTGPSINLVPQNSSGSLPIVCNWLTRSQTGFTAGCWQSQTTTLGATLTAVLGLVISPFKSGAAGVTVTWFAREPTQ